MQGCAEAWVRVCLAGPLHTCAEVCAGVNAGDSSGADDLTRKLLSLGLVARLRPRRMLSFRSDTLDRVTLPGAEERCLAYTHCCCGSSAQSLLYRVPRGESTALDRLEGRTGLP